MLAINQVECLSNESINPDGCSWRELTQKSPIVMTTTVNWIKIRGVGRQIKNFCADSFYQRFNQSNLVSREIIN